VTLVGAMLLGIVQGLTEFLPISSSAHLILGRTFFGWDADAYGLAFDVACHVGTLAAVVAFFWRDLAGMAGAVVRPFAQDESARLLRLLAVGTLPVVIVGLLWADLVEARLRTPVVAAWTLAGGALGLFLAERLGSRRRDERGITAAEAVALGVAQASALVPGVSRSGATIMLGMFFGLRREAAARFSFVLGVPAILAAAGREGLELARLGLDAQTGRLFVIGMVTSGVVGYLTITYFIRYLVHHRLDVFAWYRLGLAACVVVWLAGGHP
jgi:undecaprenyl-diphosphatase